MRQLYLLAAFLLLSGIGGASLGWAQALKEAPALSAPPQAHSIKTFGRRQKEAPVDGKIGLFVGYRPSRLQKGNIYFHYPYSVYSAKLGGSLFRDSLVYQRNIQEDVSWGIGLGATLEVGKSESFWFHLRGEGQIARYFEGASLDWGGGYEIALFDKILVQPVLLYSLGWTWLQLGELYRGTSSGNQEWYIPVRDRNFYSDVRVNLRTFYMALRPMLTASYPLAPNFMLRASAGYIIPFFHSLAIRFAGNVEDASWQSATADPRDIGSGFIYNGKPTDRSIQSFGGLMFNLEFLYTFVDK